MFNHGLNATVARAKDADAKQRKEVTTLSRAFQILELFRFTQQPLGNSEISERTGIPRPSVTRLTKALVQAGYLGFLGKMRKYELGPMILILGGAKQAATSIRQVALPHMKRMVAEERMTVDLTCPLEDVIIFLEIVREPATLTIVAEVGSCMPIDLTASGRAALWAMPPEVRANTLQLCSSRRGADWPEIEKGIYGSFTELEQGGFCIVKDVYRPGLVAVGAALNDTRRGSIYSFSCSIIDHRVEDERLVGHIGPRLLTLIESVKSEMGLMIVGFTQDDVVGQATHG